MTAYHMKPAFLALALGALGTALVAGPARAQAKAPVKVTITLGGQTQTLRGTGACGHEPRAFIYGAEAALWSAEYIQGGRHVQLSFWRLGGAANSVQFNLFVKSGSTAHQISTVKGSEPRGTGRAAFQPTAQGGRFEISGQAESGATLSVTIECARFGPIMAEGGDTQTAGGRS
jgi:hypothetical protein